MAHFEEASIAVGTTESDDRAPVKARFRSPLNAKHQGVLVSAWPSRKYEGFNPVGSLPMLRTVCGLARLRTSLAHPRTSGPHCHDGGIHARHGGRPASASFSK